MSTPTPEAEDHRHRHHVLDYGRDAEAERAHADGAYRGQPADLERCTDEQREHVARLQRMADAACDPTHPHHQRGIDDLAAIEDTEPLFVGMVRACAAQKAHDRRPQ